MTAIPFLLDGPLMTAPERRKAILERMTADVVKCGAINERADVVRALHAAGYSSFDIHCLVDDVMALVFQEIVAREMSHG